MTDTELRIVQVKGEEMLAWDYGVSEADGSPLAVIGPNAVQCPKCSAYQGKECPEGTPHMERWVLANRELARLKGIE